MFFLSIDSNVGYCAIEEIYTVEI